MMLTKDSLNRGRLKVQDRKGNPCKLNTNQKEGV